MKLLDILTSPWLIMPDKLTEIQEIYITHLRGEKIDIKGLEARLGRSLDNTNKGYEVVDGIALFYLEGIISKRMNLFSQISGGVSTELLSSDLTEALNDEKVKTILFNIDSPGGAVSGTQELAQQIFEARGNKRIVGFTDGMMASAAMWIGAAMDELYISGDTTQVGSIGVVAQHVDISEAEKRIGRKTTEVTAGKFKRIASNYKPLSSAGKAEIQEQVDKIYEAFTDDIIAFRGLDMPEKPDEDSSEKQVRAYATKLNTFAEGRIFLGEDAIKAGLVDGVRTLPALLDNLTGRASVASSSININASDGDSDETEDNMDLKELKEKHPDLYAQIVQEQTASYESGMKNGKESGAMELDAKIATAKETGAAEERSRVVEIKGHALPGHEALVEEMIADGKTTGPEAAGRILGAENALRKSKVDLFKADGENVQVDTLDTDNPDTTVDADAPAEERAEAIWKTDAKIRSEFTSKEAFIAYYKQKDAGNVKIFKQK